MEGQLRIAVTAPGGVVGQLGGWRIGRGLVAVQAIQTSAAGTSEPEPVVIDGLSGASAGRHHRTDRGALPSAVSIRRSSSGGRVGHRGGIRNLRHRRMCVMENSP
jgi:hypothetical protein